VNEGAAVTDREPGPKGRRGQADVRQRDRQGRVRLQLPVRRPVAGRSRVERQELLRPRCGSGVPLPRPHPVCRRSCRKPWNPRKCRSRWSDSDGGESGILAPRFSNSLSYKALRRNPFPEKNLRLHPISSHVIRYHPASSEFRPEFTQIFHKFEARQGNDVSIMITTRH
jgi:hypothetical protein